MPVIIRAAVHADTHGQATAAANFDWQYNLWAHRGLNVHGNQSADSSFYEHTALAPGFSQAFTVNASGRVDFWFGWGTGYQGEFQAIADPEVYIDPTFPDKDKYSIVFSPDLFPPGEPRCDISPVDSFTVMPGMPITFTVTGTAATAGETVTLNSTNLPSGVTVDGTWPASDVSAVSRTFHWTPTAGELGTPIY